MTVDVLSLLPSLAKCPCGTHNPCHLIQLYLARLLLSWATRRLSTQWLFKFFSCRIASPNIFTTMHGGFVIRDKQQIKSQHERSRDVRGREADETN
eukprot:scaffold353281_cov14-Prasinocladus_malaysianus.AAC.1